MTPPAVSPAEFAAFCLILLRVSLILSLAPIFGSNLVPAQIKIGLTLALTFALFNTVKVDPSAFPDDLIGFVPLVVRETFIALAITMILRLILEAVQLGAQYVGYQMGFAIVNVINPQTGEQSSVMAQMAYILSLLVFLSVNGHYIVIKGLVESFQLVPPGKLNLNSLVLSEVSGSVALMFASAIKIGAPALAVLFCAQISMGIVAKAVPQMNILFVGMPLYIVVGLVVFGLSLTFLIPLLSRYIASSDVSVLRLLHAM